MHSLPSEFLTRIKTIYTEQFEEIANTFEQRKPSTFRVNSLKSTPELLQKKLTELGFELEKSPLPLAFVLMNRSQRELTETEAYKNGELYIQGLSSMIPPLVLNPQQGQTVLDACSAPGSKTTQMAALMENSGQIIANDMSKVRLYKLAANLKTLGVTNTQTTHFRAQELWQKFPNTFDSVLVDVPCSLEGRFLTTNPKSYAQWSVKKVKILSDHQKHILRSAVSTAKSGATIVYSTCTLSPEENEEVVDWMLSKDSTISLQTVQIEGVPITQGISEWNGKKYANEVSKCIRILPTSLFEGFFLAKFLKA
jgi:16S rRNA (cytosine1407-C5)-methyltransferase